MLVCNPDSPVNRFSGLYIYPLVLELALSRSNLGEKEAEFSAAAAIHAIAIFVPPGTHYCWVDRGSVVSKLAQGVYTWPVLRESNLVWCIRANFRYGR